MDSFGDDSFGMDSFGDDSFGIDFGCVPEVLGVDFALAAAAPGRAPSFPLYCSAV